MTFLDINKELRAFEPDLQNDRGLRFRIQLLRGSGLMIDWLVIPGQPLTFSFIPGSEPINNNGVLEDFQFYSHWRTK